MTTHNSSLTLDKAKIIWDKAVIGMAFISAEGRWLRVNPTLCELLEYNEEELQRMKFEDITHPSDTGADWAMAKKVLAGEIEHYVMSKRYLTKTGQTIWTKLRIDRIEGEDGEFIHFLSQIIPAEVVELYRPDKARKKGVDDDDDEVTEEDIELENVVISFIKRNFKQLGASLVALVVSGYTLYREYESFKDVTAENKVVLEAHTQAIEKTAEDLAGIQTLLLEIKKELAAK